MSLRVLVYSSNAATRAAVTAALGERLSPELPLLEHVEIATPAAALAELDTGTVDLAILDGEATPMGGLGLAKQMEDELDSVPPTIVLTARRDDAWLAKWSGADAVAALPVDPFELGATAIDLLSRPSGSPAPGA